ncbi:hypothetical protein SPB21_07490 [Leptothoe sp. ISB3NOV94-8A]
MANKEIRATGLSETVHSRWQELSELLGGQTNATNMAIAVNLLYAQLCSNDWESCCRKAAILITAQLTDRSLSTIVPLHWSEINTISMNKNMVFVYTRSQGEPYLIKREEWEKG